MCYNIIRTNEKAIESFKQLDSSLPLFVDTETCRIEEETKGGLYGRVRLFQIYQKGWSKAIIYDCFFVDLELLLKTFQPFHHVYHNASYDINTINCATEEFWYPRVVSDTLFMSRLAFFDKGIRFDFYSCLRYAGVEDAAIRGIDKKLNQKADWGGHITDEMFKYAAYDVLYLSLLYPQCIHVVDKEVYKLDMYITKYMVEVARRGWPVNQDAIQAQLLDATERQEKLLRELPVNPNSPKQCREWLGVDKTDLDTLGLLKLQGDDRAGMIQDARKVSKEIMYLTRYNRPKIYAFYNACAALAGRMSCTGGDRYDHANLQQVPKRILPCIQAPEGETFVFMDYAGLELRMATAWIAEPTMLRLLKEGRDFHSYTGHKLYNKPEESLTYRERTLGKICNFLFIFGGMPGVFQMTVRAWGNIDVSFKEATQLRNKWLSEYSWFDEWHKLTKRAVNIYGYLDIKTALGRPVRTYGVNDALNFPIQGSSAEVTKMAMYYLKKRYPDENLISVIHDSITLQCKVEDEAMWIDRLNECMVDAWFYVIKNTEVPDLPMPKEAESSPIWNF